MVDRWIVTKEIDSTITTLEELASSNTVLRWYLLAASKSHQEKSLHLKTLGYEICQQANTFLEHMSDGLVFAKPVVSLACTHSEGGISSLFIWLFIGRQEMSPIHISRCMVWFWFWSRRHWAVKMGKRISSLQHHPRHLEGNLRLGCPRICWPECCAERLPGLCIGCHDCRRREQVIIEIWSLSATTWFNSTRFLEPKPHLIRIDWTIDNFESSPLIKSLSAFVLRIQSQPQLWNPSTVVGARSNPGLCLQHTSSTHHGWNYSQYFVLSYTNNLARAIWDVITSFVEGPTSRILGLAAWHMPSHSAIQKSGCVGY